MRIVAVIAAAVLSLGLFACKSGGVNQAALDNATKAVDQGSNAAADADKAKAEAEAKEKEAVKASFQVSYDTAESAYQKLKGEIEQAETEYQAWVKAATKKQQKSAEFGEMKTAYEALRTEIDTIEPAHAEALTWFEATKEAPTSEDVGALGDKFGTLSAQQTAAITKYGELKAQQTAIATKYKK